MAKPLLSNRCADLIRRGRTARRDGRPGAAKARPRVEALEGRLAPTTLTVNSLADNTNPGNFLTLREAVLLVDSGGDPHAALGRPLTPKEAAQVDTTNPFGTTDTIKFDPTTTAGGTITLAAGLSTLALSRNVSIGGPPGGITVMGPSGPSSFSIFQVTGGVTASLGGLTIASGSVPPSGFAADGGGVYNSGALTIVNCTLMNNNAAQFGGAIFNNAGATLTVNASTLTNNLSDIEGGAIYNHGTATITGSTLSGNQASQNAGAILNESGATLAVNNSTLTNNSAVSLGGAICNLATAAVGNSTLSLNTATAGSGGGIANETGAGLAVAGGDITQNTASHHGGAIFNAGTATVGDSTFSFNSALDSGPGGGAIDNLGTLSASDSTFTGNVANGNGGGLSNDSSGASIFLTSSTVAGNNAGLNGGGLYVQVGTATLVNVTLTGNRAHTSTNTGNGGGLLILAGGNDTVTLNDTVVAGNFNGAAPSTTRDDVSGALSTASSHNLIGDGTGMTGISNGDANGNQVGVTGSNPNPIDPLLAPLGLYGNVLETDPPLPGSPAIDAGAHVALTTLSAIAPAGATVLQVLDARPFIPGMALIVADTGGGAERVTIKAVNVASETVTLTGPLVDSHLQGGGLFLGTDEVSTDLLAPPGGQVDLGAFESHGFTLALVSGSPQQQAINTTFANPLVVSVTPNNPAEPVAGGAVTFTAMPFGGAQATFPNNGLVTIAADGTASATATADGVVGSYTVTATTTGASPPVVFQLTNNPPITISPTTLAPWTVNSAGYSQTLTASGGTGTYTNYSVTSGALPSGLSLNSSTGAITGTPTQAVANDTFTVTATDSGNKTGSQQISVTINPAVKLTAASLANWQALRPGYSQTLTATGGTGGKTFALAPSSNPLPPGLALASNGAITGEPTQVGTFPFSAVATDSIGATSAPQTFTIAITQGLAINPATLPNWTVNQGNYSQTLTAVGATGTVSFAVTAGALPMGLSLNSSTGVISGKPTAIGSSGFTITATDSAGATGQQSYTVAVNPAITMGPATLPAGTVGEPSYARTITASGGTGAKTFSVTAGSLPTGLSLTSNASGTATLAGTPTVAGNYTFTITAQDTEDLATGSQTYTNVVINPAVTITTLTLPDWTAGQGNYNPGNPVAASGGTGAISFSVAAGGALPMGLSLNSSTGAITGTPTVPGPYAFTIKATDAVGATGSQRYSLVINPRVTIGTTGLKAGTVNVAGYSQTIAASGGTGPLTFTVSGPTDGLTVDPSSGALTGTPTAAGTFTFSVTATDTVGATSPPQQLTLVINQPVAITTIGSTTLQAISFPPANQSVTGDSYSTSVSADGRYTVFTSTATDLVPNQVNGNDNQNIFVADLATGTATVTLVNHIPGSLTTTGDGGIDLAGLFPVTERPPRPLQPVISADGNVIVFASYDDNLVTGETGVGAGTLTIYLYDVQTGQIALGPQGASPVVSADGHYVAYVYGAGAGQGAGGIALYDRVAGKTAAIDNQGTASDPGISDDGRFVSYLDRGQVYVYDSVTGRAVLVSHDNSSPTSTTPANGASSAPVISADGSAVAFISLATDLVPNEAAGSFTNVFLFKNDTSGGDAVGPSRLVSGAGGSATAGGNGNSDSPAIDEDGSYVAYRSDATDLVGGQSATGSNIYEFNTQAGTQTLVSYVAGEATAAAGGSSEPVIDGDGHLVTYVSTAGDLIPRQSGPAGVKNVFIWLRQTEGQTGANILVSGAFDPSTGQNSPTVTGNAGSDGPLLTRDSFPGFSSRATNLLPRDTGGRSVAYINTLVAVALSPNTVALGSPSGSVVGTLSVSSLLAGQYHPPTYQLPAGPANNALFALGAPVGGTAPLLTQFQASAVQSYPILVDVNAGFGDDHVLLQVSVTGTGSPPPPPPPGITARLVPVRAGRKRKPRLMVAVFAALTGAEVESFASPFQKPAFRDIHVGVIDSNGDGIADAVVVTARKGRRRVTRIFPA
jgi:hypothetical protein